MPEVARQADPAPADADHARPPEATYLRRLLHRWFVQYNPLYLLSAALVLAGAHTLAQPFTEADDLLGPLGVPAIAELYAWALIGGAALLTRIGLRRPGVLLALLAMLYQGDLMLLTETSVYLGGAGTFAALLWLVNFAAKLPALAWAVKLRLSPSALAVPLLGAAGLVVVPRAMALAGPDGTGLILAAWWYGVGALAMWTPRALWSVVPLDAWGETVLRRAQTATWSTWALLAAGHVLYWSSDHRVSCRLLVPVGLLLATRWSRREVWIWAGLGAALLGTAAVAPSGTFLVALLGAITMGLHAFRRPDARRRLLTGAATAAYLSGWCFHWTGGAWPEHLWALDGVATVAVAVGWARGRWREPWLALGATYLHRAVVVGWLRLPATRVEWGLSTVAVGFTLLAVSLGIAYRLRPNASRDFTPSAARTLRPTIPSSRVEAGEGA